MATQDNITLAPYTFYQIGGPARSFLESGDCSEIAQALKYAKNDNNRPFILGSGSNILISDNGYDGLVVRPTMNVIERHKNELYADSGALWQDVVDYASKEGLQGIEWGQGIPGTIGGAIRGNIGAYYPTVGGTVGDIVKSVTAINKDSCEIYEIKGKDLEFDYRHSTFKGSRSGDIIIKAILELKPSNSSDLKRKNVQIQLYRDARHPKEPSAGSTFKNIKDKNFIIPFVEKTPHIRKLYTERWNGKIPAAFLIDSIGMRGFRIGKIQVSPKHANFIINLGGARAEEVIMMISTIKQRVRNRYGLQLEQEVAMIGF